MSIKGKQFVSAPYMDSSINKFIMDISVPVYDDNAEIMGVLVAAVDGFLLSHLIYDIVVGESGSCSVENEEGVTIAYKDEKLVKTYFNGIEEGKKNAQYASYATLLSKALSSQKAEVDYYTYEGVSNIASYAKMKSTGFIVILTAPYDEFMGTVQTLRLFMYGIGIGIFILSISFIITFLVSYRIVRPMASSSEKKIKYTEL